MAERHIDLSDDKSTLRRREPEAGRPNMGEASATNSFLRLHSQVGNAAIARLLAQRAEDEEEVQAKHDTVGVEGGPVGPNTAGQIDSMRGRGSPLDEGTRTSMETAFGTSFSDVRVHTGSDADTLNRHLTARAFTTGSDIFLRRDASPGDTRLLAHELTHVVQQRTMSSAGDGMRVGAAGDGYERHADAVADAVTSASANSAVDTVAQRQEDEEEVQATHDLTQRQEEEDEVQAQHDLMQRQEEEEEPT